MTIENTLSRIASNSQTADTLASVADENPTLDGATLVTTALRQSDSGIIVAWRASGPTTVGDITTAVTAAGFESSYCPEGKSVAAIFGDVMRSISSTNGFQITRVDAPAKDENGYREYCGRYRVTRPAEQSDVGQSSGDTVLVADIRDDSSEIYIKVDDSDSELVALGLHIRSKFNADRDHQVLKAGDFTKYVRGVLLYKFQAVKVGAMGWFIPSSHKSRATDFISSIRGICGKEWVIADITTSESLMTAIFEGFESEVDDLENALNISREKRAKSGHDNITENRAQKFMTQLREIQERALGYVAMCGVSTVANLQDRLTKINAYLESVLGDGAGLRFSLLELDTSPVDELETEDSYGPATRAADEALAARQTQNDDDSSWIDDPNGLPPGVVSWQADNGIESPVDINELANRYPVPDVDPITV